MGNVIFRGLNAQYVSDAFLFKKFDILGSFKIGTNWDILSDVGNSELIKRVFIVDLNASICVAGSDSVGAVVGLLMDEDSAGVPFSLYFLCSPHEKVLETFAPFIHVKCKRINSFILRKAFDLLLEFLVLNKCFWGIVECNSFHSIVYLPSAQLADVSDDKVLFIVLGSFNTEVKSHFLLVPLMILHYIKCYCTRCISYRFQWRLFCLSRVPSRPLQMMDGQMMRRHTWKWRSRKCRQGWSRQQTSNHPK